MAAHVRVHVELAVAAWEGACECCLVDCGLRDCVLRFAKLRCAVLGLRIAVLGGGFREEVFGI